MLASSKFKQAGSPLARAGHVEWLPVALGPRRRKFNMMRFMPSNVLDEQRTVYSRARGLIKSVLSRRKLEAWKPRVFSLRSGFSMALAESSEVQSDGVLRHASPPTYRAVQWTLVVNMGSERFKGLSFVCLLRNVLDVFRKLE